jgi:hypothetical protein
MVVHYHDAGCYGIDYHDVLDWIIIDYRDVDYRNIYL